MIIISYDVMFDMMFVGWKNRREKWNQTNSRLVMIGLKLIILKSSR